MARLVHQVGLGMLILLLPFAKAAVEISFGLLLLGWSLELLLDPRARARTIWRSMSLRPICWGLGAYLAACVVSMMFSDFPLHSARGLIGKWLEYLLFFVIIADLACRPKLLERAIIGLTWSSAGVLLWGLRDELALRIVSGFRETYWWHYGRMVGPYQNPIDLATYLMVVSPIIVSYAVTRSGWKRWLLGALALGLVSCLVRTHAVGAWLGLAAGLIALGFGAAQHRTAWVGLGGLAAIGGWFGSKFSIVDIGLTDRWVMWQAAIRMIQDRPVIGHGVNTFMANYLRYWVGGERQPRYAHNCYLQVAAETGLLGLAAFLWLLGAIGWCIARGVQRAKGADRTLLLGLAVGLAAFVAQAAIDTNFYALRQAALFWSLAGLALGLSERIQSPPPV